MNASDEKTSAIATALNMLGNAYRGDWSDFDGRSLRHQLDELAAALVSDEPFDLELWAANTDICPASGGWAEYCKERVPLPADHPSRAKGREFYAGNNCVHVSAIHDSRRPT